LEAAFLSITPTFIGGKIKEGKKYAITLKKFKDNVDHPLAAILTLNTFAHTIGAAGVGAQAQLIWGKEYLSISSAILTVIILIFSEIIPKTLGANYWQSLAKFTAAALKLLIYSPLYPFIIASEYITKLFRSKKNKQKSILSRLEFQAMAEKGVEEGIFKEEESKILLNLMKFNRIDVKSIMTPRTIMIAADEDMHIEEFYKSIDEINVSRIPVYKEHVDNITGFVLKDDLLQNIINNAGANPLKTIRRDILHVNEQMPIIKLFYKLINKKAHIAIVVGEYGETSGLVTMEDIIETLIGIEIMDELDDVADMQKLARKQWEDRVKRIGLLRDDASDAY
jgi:CBS domain containing-hemolysin-like protein